MENEIKLASLRDKIITLIKTLDKTSQQDEIEKLIKECFKESPYAIPNDNSNYYSLLNYYLYTFILKHYKYNEDNICMWRFFKNISIDQIECEYVEKSELEMTDLLIRTYYYSAPLDDLTCLFIPINDGNLIKKYLNWIKSYFYDVNYPTSLLWLYALDSSLASVYPDEIIYFGKRKNSSENADKNIMIPDLSYKDAVLLKRYSNDTNTFIKLIGIDANKEFQLNFEFLQNEYKERCLSRSGRQEEYIDRASYKGEWEKFEDVLAFGVSDKCETGSISFSDLRSSTTFLNMVGKNIFRNKIQQPFFEQTKLISKRYHGRIDKFMGDNVMCVFLSNKDKTQNAEIEAILNNFFALFNLCKVLLEILIKEGYIGSKLGLRSGVTFGNEILRSNLGNEIVRDFTVTGETVNLAARLEHISATELIMHNREYFNIAIERFPQISELLSISGNFKNLNPETKTIIKDFTLYQNIISNLEKLENIRFDIRLNQEFYLKLKEFMATKGYEVLNKDVSDIYGYEEYEVDGFNLKFYFSYYNPKGFSKYEKIWILPLSIEMLKNFNIEKIKE